MINLEWAKLKAVAKHLNCTEMQAKDRLDEGSVQVFTAEELSNLRAFLKRLQVEPLDESVLTQVSHDDNNFLLWEKV